MPDKDNQNFALHLAQQQIGMLKEANQEKDGTIAESKKQYDRLAKWARELAETILSQNPEETQLGTRGKDWGKQDIIDLIRAAQNTQQQLVQQNAGVIQNLLRELRDRGQKIEDLVAQIEQLGIDHQSALEYAERQREEKEAYELADKAMRDGIDDGTVQVVLEEGDMSQAQIAAIEEAMGSEPMMPNGPKIVDKSKPQATEKQDQKPPKPEASTYQLVDLKTIQQGFEDIEWAIIEAIGVHGYTKLANVLSFVFKKFNKTENDPDAKTFEGQVRRAITKIANANAVGKIQVNLPGKKILVLGLTPIGKQLCEKQYGKPVCETEDDLVVKSHDNREHGYGILEIGDCLRESTKYKNVNCFCSKIPVKIGDRDFFYIPDIEAVPAGKRYTEYFEYERGNTGQTDFNAKCDKMCCVTNYLNFVAPNSEVAKHLHDQLARWAEARPKTQRTVHMRVFTSTGMKKSMEPLYESELSKGALNIKKTPQISAG